jgi:hypothetical protein|tara:strand:- start:11898 stop:12656 length:759 start_codon:yes stop_codon:yes gene_type:complete
MSKAVLESKEWLNLLGSIGERMEDVKLVLNKSGTIEYDAAHSSHYIHYKGTYPDAVKESGNLVFTDLKKAKTFLKKCKGNVTIQQSATRLSLKSGTMKMTLPILDCKSTQLAPTLAKLTLKAKNGKWGTFGRGVFTTHGETDFSDLIDGANIAKSLSADADFLIKANADEKELVLHAFKKGGAAIICTATIENAQGPNHTVSSSFGPWLLSCLSILNPKVKSTFHCGDSTVLAVEQSGEGWERTIVVIDQQA